MEIIESGTAEEHAANAARLLAEADRNKAEAAKLRAETASEKASTRRAKAMAVEAEVKARRAKDEDDARRASDDFHHVYRYDGEITAAGVKATISKLTEWRRLDPASTIEIIFSSPGGSIFDGMELFDFLVDLGRDAPVVTGGAGMAASMAGILVQAGTTRYVTRQCQPPNALVLVPDLGWVKHGDLGVGQEIVAFDEAPVNGSRRWRRATVVSADRAISPVYEVRLEDGTTHVTTGDHRWLTAGGWRATEDFNKNRGPTRVKRLVEETHHEYTHESGWMARFLDGEGCLSGGARYGPTGGFDSSGGGMQLVVSQVYGPVLDRAVAFLSAHGFNYGSWPTNAPRYSPAQPLGRLVITDRAEILRLLMLVRPERLIQKALPLLEGSRLQGKYLAVAGVTPLGEEEVVQLQTSAGTYVGNGLAHHNCWYLIHRAGFGAGGKTFEVEDRVELIKRIEDRIIDIFTSRSTLTRQKIRKNWDRKDWWLSADDCLEMGLVDEVRGAASVGLGE